MCIRDRAKPLPPTSGGQPTAQQRRALAAEAVLAAWRAQWTSGFTPVAKIKQTLLAVDGVREVFRSSSLGVLICVLDDGSAVAVPSARDFANSDVCYDATTRPSQVSRLMDVERLAEVSADGRTVLTKGLARISDA